MFISMVSDDLSKRNKVILERVLEANIPQEKDLIFLFGGEELYTHFLKTGDPQNQMMEIAYQLTPDRDHRMDNPDCRHYGIEARNWQENFALGGKKTT